MPVTTSRSPAQSNHVAFLEASPSLPHAMHAHARPRYYSGSDMAAGCQAETLGGCERQRVWKVPTHGSAAVADERTVTDAGEPEGSIGGRRVRPPVTVSQLRTLAYCSMRIDECLAAGWEQGRPPTTTPTAHPRVASWADCMACHLQSAMDMALVYWHAGEKWQWHGRRRSACSWLAGWLHWERGKPQR
jgi:hypothetical protein